MSNNVNEKNINLPPSITYVGSIYVPYGDIPEENLTINDVKISDEKKEELEKYGTNCYFLITINYVEGGKRCDVYVAKTKEELVLFALIKYGNFDMKYLLDFISEYDQQFFFEVFPHLLEHKRTEQEYVDWESTDHTSEEYFEWKKVRYFEWDSSEADRIYADYTKDCIFSNFSKLLEEPDEFLQVLYQYYDNDKSDVYSSFMEQLSDCMYYSYIGNTSCIMYESNDIHYHILYKLIQRKVSLTMYHLKIEYADYNYDVIYGPSQITGDNFVFPKLNQN